MSTSKHTQLQKRIAYQFSDRKLLDQALRHASRGGADNQRLEFLGDRVLGLVIADALYHEFPEAREGELAPRYNHLVRKESCAEIAESLLLGDELALGRSEAMSGGRRKTALLGDVVEALIAAIYLDGGYNAARDFILRQWQVKLCDLPEETVDAKTRLQEFVQARGEPVPKYEIIDRSGPDHAPKFTVRVQTEHQQDQGTGNSRRKAEQEAANALIKRLEEIQ